MTTQRGIFLGRGPIFAWIALTLAVTCPAAAGTIVYGNTTSDTGDSLNFAVGPYSEIGDQIHLSGTDRYATSATVQFYNNGTSAGTFDVTLRLLNIGSPVGSLLNSFTVTGVSAPLAGSSGFNVDFNDLQTLVPDDLIFTVSVANVSAGVDLGVDLFEPPETGSSDNTFLIVNNGSYAQAASASENVFFQLQAGAVPEPSVIAMFATGLAALAALQRIRRRA